jgi:sigma-E factor negative regulatory protein RseB
MRRAVAAAALLIAGLGAPLAEAGDRSAGEWLEQMTRALASLNYDGLFTHTAANQSETMRIVHSYADGRSVERLVSLDGSGREIVRTPEEVHFYMPDRRVVLVEPRSDDGSLLRSLPKPGPQLDAVYTLAVQKGTKLLGREVRILDIRPRDDYRYGYRLWLDEKSAMPLRSEVLNGAGLVVEAIHFTRLEVHDRIKPRELEPAVDAAGFQWMRAPRRPDARVATAGEWRPRKVPPGFRLVATRVHAMPNSPMKMTHLVFSDGVATVSVFIEPGNAAGPAPPESTSVGSANAYSTQVSGFVVTAVGEVPPATVRDIATSLAPAEAAPAPAQPPRNR